MPTVHHFDIPIDDLDRAQKFYKDVFGWGMKKVIPQTHGQNYGYEKPKTYMAIKASQGD